MKKTIASVMAGALALGMLAGCSSGDTQTSNSDANTSTDTEQTQEKYRLLSEDFGAEEYGIAFKKGNVDLALEVQKQMEAMQQDGTGEEISKQWFGEDILLKDQSFYNEQEMAQTGDGSLQAVLDKGTLVLGLDASFPPMGFTAENGDIVGFDIDLATEVCERMGVKLEPKPINWNSKEQELENGNIDCIWNGLSVDESRLEMMTIAKPYLANAQVIMVPADSDIQTKADLEGKVVGLQAGSTALSAVQADTAAVESFKELREYEDNVMAISDMDNGRLDAVVLDVIVARYIMSQQQ